MDRVDIPNEPRGEATYYLVYSPEEFCKRIYQMEKEGSITISNSKVTTNKGTKTFETKQELKTLIKNNNVKACEYDTRFNDEETKIRVDFDARRITLTNEKEHFDELLYELTKIYDKDECRNKLTEIGNLLWVGSFVFFVLSLFPLLHAFLNTAFVLLAFSFIFDISGELVVFYRKNKGKIF